jgi:hypothetical protein
MNLPTDVVQQSLDAAGIDYLLGDIEDGSRPAQVLLRAYQQCLMQLLRGCNWDFARKTEQLTLLADATGNTPNVGAVVPVPYIYEYAYPIDCVKARFVPWNMPWQNPGIPPGNIRTGFVVQAGQPQPPLGTPPITGLGNPQLTGNRIRPARFVVATDSNYPADATSIDTLGVSPAGRTVILTNVQFAFLIYTQLVLYPSQWDALFRAALVAYLASEIALPLAADKKFGMAMRRDNIAVAKAKIEQARIRDGNEGFYSSNLAVDWMAARWTGGAGGWGSNWIDGGGGGPNNSGAWGGWDACGFADGTAY